MGHLVETAPHHRKGVRRDFRGDCLVVAPTNGESNDVAVAALIDGGEYCPPLVLRQRRSRWVSSHSHDMSAMGSNAAPETRFTTNDSLVDGVRVRPTLATCTASMVGASMVGADQKNLAQSPV